MSGLTGLANRIWVWLCLWDSWNYQRTLNRVALVQQRLLRSLLRANAGTVYGQEYDFAALDSIVAYQKQVPITEYRDYQPYIRRLREGERRVLTAEPVILFELSSGSTDASKLIPYTQGLKRQFGVGINAWVANLYRHYPGLYRGKAYWSVTPVAHEPAAAQGGIPVGFEQDQEYLGAAAKYFLALIFAVPGEVRLIRDLETFRYVTLLFLLKARDLALFSVWHPTFLILLLKPLRQWQEQLIADLHCGILHPPRELDPALQQSLQRRLGKNPKRAAELQRIFRQPSRPEESSNHRTLYERLWPCLQLISCWTDANAALQLPQLRTLFPSIPVQGKGLLATEGFISLPYDCENGARLSYRSHFFEFEEVDPQGFRTGKINLAHQVEAGRTYTVILTTAGGFYRYRLADLVQVEGWAGQCPRLRFVGKESLNSDLCGEKLNEVHVRRSLEAAFGQLGLTPLFYLLAPEVHGETAWYGLFVEWARDESVTPERLRELVRLIEAGLGENFHYRYCRQLGQLGPVRVFGIVGAQTSGIAVYQRVCRESGQREGNIKLYALHHRCGWAEQFAGAWQDLKEE